METIWYHIDVNSAFLSFEAADRIRNGDPLDIRTIPAVIGGSEKDRHGIVLAKSLETKRYGIKTGEPLVSARQKCPNLLVIPPDYAMYVEASKAFIAILKRYSANVQQYSIDEAFVEMTGTEQLLGQPVVFAEELKDLIYEELGFTVNIGVANNKLLAKFASDLKKPNRVHTLFPWEMKTKMWPHPVEDLFFVGSRTAKRLHQLGINTIGELAKTDPKYLYTMFKSHGIVIHNFANGIADDFDKMTLHPVNKGYGNSTTINHDVTNETEAKMVLLSLTETVGARIRADKKFVSVVSVSIVDCNFNYASHQMTLHSATDITKQIYEAACNLFDRLWNHEPIRQLGVHTHKAAGNSMYQYSLFDIQSADKLQQLDTAIDNIRIRYGEDAIMRACFLNSWQKHFAGGLDSAKRTGITKEL